MRKRGLARKAGYARSGRHRFDDEDDGGDGGGDGDGDDERSGLGSSCGAGTETRSLLCRALRILLLAALFAIVVAVVSPYLRELSGASGNTDDGNGDLVKDENQLRTPDNDTAPTTAPTEEPLTPEEERILRLPSDVLTETLDISLYFSWKKEKQFSESYTESFVKDEYNALLPIPSFMVDDGTSEDESYDDTEDPETTVVGAIASSSSTSLLRYVAMRGELYPLTTPDDDNYNCLDDDDDNDDCLDEDEDDDCREDDGLFLEGIDERMKQALYVDELLERMKGMEAYLRDQMEEIRATTTSPSSEGSVRGAGRQQKLVRAATRKIKQYLDFAERLLSGHLVPSFFKDRDLTVADLVIFCLSNRIFPARGREDKLVPALDGAINSNEYPKIGKSVRRVSRDEIIQEYFANGL